MPDNPGTPARAPRLLDRVRDCLRHRYSPRTEEAYVQWIRRFILFHDKLHPADMTAIEVTAFLSQLVRNRGLAAAPLYRDYREASPVAGPGGTASGYPFHRIKVKLLNEDIQYPPAF